MTLLFRYQPPNPKQTLQVSTLNPQQKGHPDRSEAQWRDLLFHSATSQSPLGAPLFPLSSRPERTRISCHAALDKAAYAPFRKEGRTKCTNATKFHRKSGVAQWRDLQFSGRVLEMFFGQSIAQRMGLSRQKQTLPNQKRLHHNIIGRLSRREQRQQGSGIRAHHRNIP
jgi:hypothetical protein